MPLNFFKEEMRRHKARHTPTADGFAGADSIDYLVGEHWDTVTKKAGAFFRRSYLRALEAHPPEGMLFRYALIYRAQQPVAALVVQALTLDMSNFVPTGSPLALGGKHIRQRLVVCGSLLCWGNQGVAFAPGVDPATVWPTVAEAVYRIRRADKLHGETDFVLFREFLESDTCCRCLEDYEYHDAEVEPDMIMDLHGWSKFDDYLNSLASKYRKAAKSVISKIEKAGGRLTRLTDLGPHQERIDELYNSVWANSDVRPVRFHPGYLPALVEALGEDYAFWGAFQHDRMIGYVTVVNCGEQAIGYMLGFDRRAAEELPIYLRLLYAVIEQALEWKCRRISFGGTALEPKARLGCRPEPRRVWVRHRLAPLNVLVGPLVEAISPQQPPERNPFKQIEKA